MRTREIAHGEWQPFFRSFTALHHGEHINVETMTAECHGIVPRLRDLPLVGIVTAEPVPEGLEKDWIEVVASKSVRECSTHRIPEPARVLLAEEENGKAVALQVDSADGSITMVRFQPPVEGLPEGFKVV